MAVDRRPRRPSPSVEPTRCHGRRASSLLPWTGGACLAAAGLLTGGALLVAPLPALALLAASALLLTVGREAAAPAGLLLGADPWLLAAQLLLLDAGLLLALAPRVAGPRPPAVVANAARRRNGARRLGSLAGLYGRALMPFAFLGGLVATLMGEAAGLPPRRLLLVVLAACATATLAWCGLYAAALALMGKPALAAALAIAVPLGLLGATVSLVGSRRDARAALRS
ncbi:MAG: hypothetical protein QOG31_1546 [Thermoplasmata archaeon]|nr:hypothetical protein [Thermoplasmata archaeon]